VGSNNSTVVKSLTMKTYVRAADLGHPRAPGNYRCDGDTVQVEQSHIDTWRDEPRAAFRAVYVGKGLDPDDSEYVLGLRDPLAEKGAP
jgi:hypothetical protein